MTAHKSAYANVEAELLRLTTALEAMTERAKRIGAEVDATNAKLIDTRCALGGMRTERDVARSARKHVQEKLEAAERDLAALRELVSVRTEGLAELQKHRDDWRGYAYGTREKPLDFLDGNMTNRPQTKIEQLEEAHTQALREARREAFVVGSAAARRYLRDGEPSFDEVFTAFLASKDKQ